MAVMKEWVCAKHGGFEGSHPICPSMGCMSEEVTREFRTPVAVSKGQYNRFDRGLRKTADMMNVSNWRTARTGESSFMGRGVDAPLGTEVLWGNEVAKHPAMGGRSFAALTAAAGQPLTTLDKPVNDPYVRVNNGMRAAATTLGVTRRTLPPAEITAARGE